MVDQLITALNVVCTQLLPILGAAALLFGILLLKRCIVFIDECTKRVKQLETTVQGVDQSIEKLQAPLNTVVKVSETVDNAQQSAVTCIKQVASYVSDTFGTVKENKVKSEFSKEEKTEDKVASPQTEKGE